MFIEIMQILYRIHNHLDENIEYSFNKKKGINIGLNVCKWIQ